MGYNVENEKTQGHNVEKPKIKYIQSSKVSTKATSTRRVNIYNFSKTLFQTPKATLLKF